MSLHALGIWEGYKWKTLNENDGLAMRGFVLKTYLGFSS